MTTSTAVSGKGVNVGVTRRAIGPAVFAAGAGRPHPYADRAVRTALNALLRRRGVPAKMCSRCMVVRNLSAFHRFASASDGLRSFCRLCHSEVHRRKQATDASYRQTAAARARAYYAEYPAERRAYGAARKRKIRAANVARHANRVQDPDVLKLCVGRCGLLLPETSFRLDRGEPDGLRARCRECATSVARQLCQDTYGAPVGHTCYLCMSSITSSADAHADHLHPQALGGVDEATNLRWTHAFCNTSRGDRLLTAEEWARIDLLNTNGVKP
ncbi:hypothetical protein [Streptomyces sp. NPDC046371]|uniref:hypothetical protein n=1 Tax=Streptomyces sp. NPDC046371 TaxID=3154916 RepID=UPI0033D2CBDA